MIALGLFFTSDTHFGADGIIEREHRPFKNAEEYKIKQIEIWNIQADENDIIKHLGDWVSFNDKEIDSWKDGFISVKNVKAQVDLILGNNEYRIIDKVYSGNKQKFIEELQNIGFRNILDNEVVQLRNRKVYLVNKPSQYNKDYLTLFGHTHRSTGLYKPFGFNMCTDLNYFRLYTEEDIEWLEEQAEKFWRADLDTNFMG